MTSISFNYLEHAKVPFRFDNQTNKRNKISTNVVCPIFLKNNGTMPHQVDIWEVSDAQKENIKNVSKLAMIRYQKMQASKILRSEISCHRICMTISKITLNDTYIESCFHQVLILAEITHKSIASACFSHTIHQEVYQMVSYKILSWPSVGYS